MKLNIEKLEARIAPGGCNPDPCHDDHDDKDCHDKQKGNNGFGNGGDDGSNAGKQDATR